MIAGPHTRYARWRASRIWLRNPRRALKQLGTPPQPARLNGPQLALRAWLALHYERDVPAAEEMARTALQRSGDTRFAAAALADALVRGGHHDEAIEVLRSARARFTGTPWYELSLADALEAAGQVDEAIELLVGAADVPDLRRHVLKRLARIQLERGERAEARRWLAELVGLAPDYLVYASDYVTLGQLALDDGDRETAREVWRAGARIYPRHAQLRALRDEHFGESQPLAAPRIAAVAEGELGVRRIAIRTELITPSTDLAALMDSATAGQRREGDVIAIAESATATAQGRILPLELVRPGSLARLLSRFVGSIGPLHSPEGMQGAIMESGRVRVVAGAIIGGLGRPLGRRGWFYRVAGPRTAMIDDVAACLPPHDHHLIFGPIELDELTAGLADRLGCGVAVVDANHRTGAWVLAASPGVDHAWLARALADNPAGNEDEQTPLVIVRSVRSDGAGAPAGVEGSLEAPEPQALGG